MQLEYKALLQTMEDMKSHYHSAFENQKSTISQLNLRNNSVSDQLLRSINAMTLISKEYETMKLELEDKQLQLDGMRNFNAENEISSKLLPSLGKICAMFLELYSLTDKEFIPTEREYDGENITLFSVQYIEELGEQLKLRFSSNRKETALLMKEVESMKVHNLELTLQLERMINQFGKVLDGKCSSTCTSISSILKRENIQLKNELHKCKSIIDQVNSVCDGEQVLKIVDGEQTLKKLIDVFPLPKYNKTGGNYPMLLY